MAANSGVFTVEDTSSDSSGSSTDVTTAGPSPINSFARRSSQSQSPTAATSPQKKTLVRRTVSKTVAERERVRRASFTQRPSVRQAPVPGAAALEKVASSGVFTIESTLQSDASKAFQFAPKPSLGESSFHVESSTAFTIASSSKPQSPAKKKVVVPQDSSVFTLPSSDSEAAKAPTPKAVVAKPKAEESGFFFVASESGSALGTPVKPPAPAAARPRAEESGFFAIPSDSDTTSHGGGASPPLPVGQQRPQPLPTRRSESGFFTVQTDSGRTTPLPDASAAFSIASTTPRQGQDAFSAAFSIASQSVRQGPPPKGAAAFRSSSAQFSIESSTTPRPQLQASTPAELRQSVSLSQAPSPSASGSAILYRVRQDHCVEQEGLGRYYMSFTEVIARQEVLARRTIATARVRAEAFLRVETNEYDGRRALEAAQAQEAHATGLLHRTGLEWVVSARAVTKHWDAHTATVLLGVFGEMEDRLSLQQHEALKRSTLGSPAMLRLFGEEGARRSSLEREFFIGLGEVQLDALMLVETRARRVIERSAMDTQTMFYDSPEDFELLKRKVLIDATEAKQRLGAHEAQVRRKLRMLQQLEEDDVVGNVMVNSLVSGIHHKGRLEVVAAEEADRVLLHNFRDAMATYDRHLQALVVEHDEECYAELFQFIDFLHFQGREELFDAYFVATQNLVGHPNAWVLMHGTAPWLEGPVTVFSAPYQRNLLQPATKSRRPRRNRRQTVKAQALPARARHHRDVRLYKAQVHRRQATFAAARREATLLAVAPLLRRVANGYRQRVRLGVLRRYSRHQNKCSVSIQRWWRAVITPRWYAAVVVRRHRAALVRDEACEALVHRMVDATTLQTFARAAHAQLLRTYKWQRVILEKSGVLSKWVGQRVALRKAAELRRQRREGRAREELAERRHHAARLIQCLFRRFVARGVLHNKRAWYRRRVRDRELRELQPYAAVKVQRRVRVFLCQRLLARLKKAWRQRMERRERREMQGVYATRIQALFRGVAARRYYAALYEDAVARRIEVMVSRLGAVRQKCHVDANLHLTVRPSTDPHSLLPHQSRPYTAPAVGNTTAATGVLAQGPTSGATTPKSRSVTPPRRSPANRSPATHTPQKRDEPSDSESISSQRLGSPIPRTNTLNTFVVDASRPVSRGTSPGRASPPPPAAAQAQEEPKPHRASDYAQSLKDEARRSQRAAPKKAPATTRPTLIQRHREQVQEDCIRRAIDNAQSLLLDARRNHVEMIRSARKYHDPYAVQSPQKKRQPSARGTQQAPPVYENAVAVPTLSTSALQGVPSPSSRPATPHESHRSHTSHAPSVSGAAIRQNTTLVSQLAQHSGVSAFMMEDLQSAIKVRAGNIRARLKPQQGDYTRSRTSSKKPSSRAASAASRGSRMQRNTSIVHYVSESHLH